MEVKKTKRIAVFILMLGAALLLSGCLKMHIDIVWRDDNSGTVSVTIGVSKAAITMMGGTEEEMQEQLRETMTGDSDDGIEYTIKNYTDDEYTGIIYSVEVDDLTRNDFEVVQQLRFETSGEGKNKTYSVSGDYSVSDDIGDPDELGVSTSDIDTRLSITMPGRITSHNATEKNGNTLIWDLSSDTAVRIDARSEASGGGFMNILMWILFILSILALIGLAVLVILKKNQASQAVAPAAYVAPPPQAQAGQTPYAQYQEPVAYPPAQAAPATYGNVPPQQQAAPYAAQAPAAASAPVRCTGCGALLPENTSFCSVCGKTIMNQ